MNNDLETCTIFKLIFVIVEAGRGSQIMTLAREAGAEGGTTLFARGTSIHERGKFLGVPIEPEKEVVMILIPESLATQVFEAVVRQGELDTSGKGIAFMIDVCRVAGICHLNTEP